MKVLLLIEPPKRKFSYLTQLQPLGVLYIASFLESKGIHTDVLDFNVQQRRQLNYSNYDLIGFSATSGNIENTLKAAKEIKKTSKAEIFLGGPIVELAAEKLIAFPFIDVLVAGEAEDIIFNYLTSKNKNSVKGLWLKKQGKTVYTGKSESIRDLDSLPFPSLEKIPYKKYNVVLSKYDPVAAIITSRGCPYGCIFCSHSLGYKFRERSPRNVIEELKRDIDLGIKELWIADDNFTHDINRVFEICDLIIQQKLKISLSLANGIRADKINIELLRKLKAAGCWFITMAPEVGDEESLLKVKKGFSLTQAKKAVELAKQSNIFIMVNFIIGFPWEKEDNIMQTIKFAKELDADLTHFSRIIPYPKTPLWKMSMKKEYNLIDEAHNFGGLRYNHPFIKEARFNELIKVAYRQTMISPKKIAKLISNIGIKKMIMLAKYALDTRSV